MSVVLQRLSQVLKDESKGSRLIKQVLMHAVASLQMMPAHVQPRMFRGVQPPDISMLAAVSGVNGTARSAARVATPRVKTQPEAARPVPTAPLTAVVHDAVRRWFQEAHKEAQRGDVVSSAALPAVLPVKKRAAQSCLVTCLRPELFEKRQRSHSMPCIIIYA